MSALFDAALAYAQRGLPVFPLWPVVRDARGYFICGCSKLECPNPGKHPLPRLAPNGLKDASTDPAKVKHWWFVWPSANVGIATHGLVVVDVDPRHHGDATMRELVDRYGPLPATWRVNTGGCGLHIYFLPPDGIQISSGVNQLGEGIDIRARGGYVVAPPSSHVSGKLYRWRAGCGLDIPLARFPAGLLDHLARQQQQTKPATDWHGLSASEVPEGQRNGNLTRLAGLLLRRSLDPQVVLELLLPWNAMRCKPPLAAAEVAQIVNSIARREQRRREANHASIGG
jgi:Bifunctional DNA primase/polymerase, N-terminal/Primase C terminal 1 (PriCT-1)